MAKFPTDDNLSISRQPRGGPPPSGHWSWFNTEMIDIYLPKIGLAAVGVYAGLVRYAHAQTQTCWPSVERLAHDLGSTPDRIMGELRTLEEHGLIAMKVRYHGRGHYPLYLFTLLAIPTPVPEAPAPPPPPAPAPVLTPYGQKLRDPRWQKKRLEVFTIDHWQCQNCGDTTTTLQVHHHTYKAGCDPWDYPLEDLATLCEPCHEAVTEAKKRLSQGGQP